MKNRLNKITDTVIGVAIAVHRALGLGLLESTYEACLAYEISERGQRVERQKALPVKYRGVNHNVPKAGGLQSQGVKGEAVVSYREFLTTQDLKSSGFPEG